MLKKGLFFVNTFIIILVCSLGIFSEDLNYKVVEKDTLWDLAGKHYQNPWLWKKIFEANSETVKNPDLIYPNQEIIIPGLNSVDVLAEPPAIAEEPEAVQEAEPVQEVALAEPPSPEAKTEEPEVSPEPPAPVEETAETVQQAPVEEPVPEQTIEEPVAEESEPEIVEEVEEEKPVVEPPKKAIKPKKTKGKTKYGAPNSFVVPMNYNRDGKIVGSKDGRTLISQSDTVFIDIGSNSGIKEGIRLDVYRKKDKVRDNDGNLIGYQVLRVGILEITREVNRTSSTAIVLKSYEPLVKGDYVKISEE